jgi:hypothetical protein
MREKLKVPLQVAWLSESGLLYKAADLLGCKVSSLGDLGPVLKWPTLIPPSIGKGQSMAHFQTSWTDHFEFTLAELVQLGFETGDFEVCPACDRLKVVCDAERAEEHDRNHADQQLAEKQDQEASDRILEESFADLPSEIFPLAHHPDPEDD